MKVFGVEKFKGLLLAGSFTVLAGYVVRLSDTIIAGRLLGENALAGVNLVGPFLSCISFFGGLFATGMATNYSIAMGRCDRLRARQFFMQALWSALVVGCLFTLAVFLGGEAFLNYMGAAPDVTAYAREYMYCIAPLAIIDSLVMLNVALGYADGDSKLCAVAYAMIFIGNFIASIVAVKMGYGIAGCAVGSVIAESAGLLVLLLHFFRKSNTFSPVRHFSLADSGRIVASSFGDASSFFCDGLLFFFLNKFLIMNFGSAVLPALGVVTAVWGLLEVFNGIGVAIQPIVTVYFGERNTKSIRAVMRAAMKIAFLEGVIAMVVLCLFPSFVVRMIGVDDPASLALASRAVRLMSFGFVALAFAGLFNSYYMFVERAALAGIVTFLSYLIMPVACVACFSLAGINWVWAGLAAGPFVALLITASAIVVLVGHRAFPLLLPHVRERRFHVFDLTLDDKSVAATSQAVGDTIRATGISPSVALRAALLTEEVFMVVKDRARGRKLLGEATLDLNDGIKLTLRDDGEIFDITDADARISSLRTFLVASMMAAHDGRMNLITTGFNRNVFRF